MVGNLITKQMRKQKNAPIHAVITICTRFPLSTNSLNQFDVVLMSAKPTLQFQLGYQQ